MPKKPGPALVALSHSTRPPSPGPSAYAVPSAWVMSLRSRSPSWPKPPARRRATSPVCSTSRRASQVSSRHSADGAGPRSECPRGWSSSRRSTRPWARHPVPSSPRTTASVPVSVSASRRSPSARAERRLRCRLVCGPAPVAVVTSSEQRPSACTALTESVSSPRRSRTGPVPVISASTATQGAGCGSGCLEKEPGPVSSTCTAPGDTRSSGRRRATSSNLPGAPGPRRGPGRGAGAGLRTAPAVRARRRPAPPRPRARREAARPRRCARRARAPRARPRRPRPGAGPG